jgi:hypothetical protein
MIRLIRRGDGASDASDNLIYWARVASREFDKLQADAFE